jgi:hypothetical protein
VPHAQVVARPVAGELQKVEEGQGAGRHERRGRGGQDEPHLSNSRKRSDCKILCILGIRMPEVYFSQHILLPGSNPRKVSVL